MLRTAAQKASAAITTAIIFFSVMPASAGENLESRIQMLEQELRLIKELLQSQIKPTQVLSVPSKTKGFSTLPGWSAGYRYNLNADDKSATRIRLFLKKKSLTGNVVKVAWERQTGQIPNFFKTGTIDGDSLNKWGTIYIEQEIKF